MATDFTLTPSFLQVTFLDNTAGATTWSWDFGDSTPLGTTSNPVHTYAAAGKYTVQLTTDIGGAYSRNIIVDTKAVLPVTLSDYITAKLPKNISISQTTKDAYTAQWQLYLAPLVTPVIADSNFFNEFYYPPLANALIATLVAHSIMGDIAYGNAGTSMAGGKGGVKQIVTGPSSAEWYDASAMVKAYFGTGGPYDSLTKEVCMLASRLGLSLPMCPPLPKPIILPIKAGRTSSSLFKGYESWWSLFPMNVQITI